MPFAESFPLQMNPNARTAAARTSSSGSAIARKSSGMAKAALGPTSPSAMRNLMRTLPSPALIRSLRAGTAAAPILPS